MWTNLKNSIYCLGWTFVLVLLVKQNIDILHEMWWTAPGWVIITVTLCTTMLYPLWIIGIIGIVHQWRQELNYARLNKEDCTTSDSS